MAARLTPWERFAKSLQEIVISANGPYWLARDESLVRQDKNLRFHYTNLIVVRIYFLIIFIRICLIIAFYPLIYLPLMSLPFFWSIDSLVPRIAIGGVKSKGKKAVILLTDVRNGKNSKEYKLISNFNNERSLLYVMYVVTLWPISIALKTGFQFSKIAKTRLTRPPTNLGLTIALSLTATNKTTHSLRLSKGLIIGQNEYKDEQPISTVL